MEFINLIFIHFCFITMLVGTASVLPLKTSSLYVEVKIISYNLVSKNVKIILHEMSNWYFNRNLSLCLLNKTGWVFYLRADTVSKCEQTQNNLIAGRTGLLMTSRSNSQGWNYILLGVQGWGHPILLRPLLSQSSLTPTYVPKVKFPSPEDPPPST